MDHIASSPDTETEMERTEIDDLVQALHTLYEFANMPSMVICQRHSNGEDISSQPQYIAAGKSTSEATEVKDEADKLFFKKEYDEAVFAYTECLRYAEKDDEIVAEAYANRSAASFKLGKYLECKNDITRALRKNYPEDKRKMLFERYKRCTSLLNNPPKPANNAVASSSNQADASREKPVEVDVRILRDEIDAEWREMCADLTNPLLRRTSNKIRLECNETWGRHMVASKYIKAGEILSCERFHSIWVPYDESVWRCSYCYSISYALIPCNLCSMAMYCSTYCRRRAFNLFHRIECRIFRHEELSEITTERSTMMALRMLLVGTDQGAGLETLMKKMTMRDIFAEKVDPEPNEPFSSDYSDVLKLTRTFPKPLLCFNSKPGLVVRMIIALQDTRYFGRRNAWPEKRLTDTELFTALLLVNHMLSVRSSSFRLIRSLNPDGSKKKLVGLGVPILHNMLNHSCNPNAFILSRYNENALVAIRPILNNEQIFIAYCERYWDAPLRKRQEQLARQSFIPPFTCKCEACIEDWPMAEDLKYKPGKFLGTSDVKKFNEELEQGLHASVTGMSRTEIRHAISRVGGWLNSNLAKPSTAAIICEHLQQAFMKYVYDTFKVDIDTNRQDVMMKEVSIILSYIKDQVDRLIHT